MLLHLRPASSVLIQGAKTSSGVADKVSRFKEPSSEALMDDLFESSHVRPQDTSTSAPSDHGLPPRGGPVLDTASAGKLKSKVPQKKISNADGAKRSSVDLFTALIDVDEKEIDISELVLALLPNHCQPIVTYGSVAIVLCQDIYPDGGLCFSFLVYHQFHFLGGPLILFIYSLKGTVGLFLYITYLPITKVVFL